MFTGGIAKIRNNIRRIVFIDIHNFIDFDSPLNFYDGQVTLCPSDDAQNDDSIKSSTSYGVISLYYAEAKVWMGLNQNYFTTPLGSNEADTICRQMGYTGFLPGTIAARSDAPYSFDKC